MDSGSRVITTVPFSRRRQAIARRLTYSAQTIPHFYLATDVEMTEAIAWQEATNAHLGLHITVTDLVVKAAAEAMSVAPRLNGHVQEEAITLYPEVNVGIAVALDDGLLVPVVPQVDALSLPAISDCARRNAAAARQGVLSPSPAATFTVSSLGMYGVTHFLPLINPPECAILAVGAIIPRVLPKASEFVVQSVMTVTLACDHRAVDGVEAASFLQELRRLLESAPATLDAWLGSESE